MEHNERFVSSGRKRLSAWSRTFIVLFLVFLAAGFCTIGSFKNTGKALSFFNSDGYTAVYELNYAGNQSRLKAVYVNVGNIYLDPGEDLTITVKRSTSTSSTVQPTASCGSVTIGNFYSEKSGVSGGNFNWVCVVDKGDSPQIAYRIALSASANFDLNEIVCLAGDGSVISLSVNPYLNSGFDKKELAYAIDAQESFSTDNSALRNFTQEEGYYMSAIRTVLGGRKVAENSAYNVDRDFNSLATVLLLPSVALFGNSVAALRLTPLLATALALVFVYLFGRLLFKEEKYAFAFALLFAVGGFAATVGRLGAPYALVCSALLGSAYFMYRFFAKGISSKRPVGGAMNIFVSGAFAAFALAMNLLTVFPVAGILVLFGFGLRRLRLACVYEREKAEAAALAAPTAEEGEAETNGITDGETDAESPKVVESPQKIQAAYRYKRKIAWAFAAASFVVLAFLLTVLAGTITYTAYVKTYDDPTAPTMGFAALLWKGISAPFKIENLTSYTRTNAASAMSWFLPMKAATLYGGIVAPSDDGSRFLAWNVSMNSALAVLSLFAFCFSTVSVIADCFGENKNKKDVKRNRRIYLVLLVGLLSNLLSSLFVGNTSAAQGMTFSVFYAGFVPLAAILLRPVEPRLQENGKTAVAASDVALWICAGIVVVFFLLALPGEYGFEISTKAQKILFDWMSVFSNGYVGIKAP